MKYPNRIFSGDHSKVMWNAINNAKTKSDLREALYLVCCRLQELEERIAAQQDQRDNPPIDLGTVAPGLSASATFDPAMTTFSAAPKDLIQQISLEAVERRLIRVVEEVSMLDRKIAELQLLAGRTQTYTKEQIESIATGAVIKIVHKVISNRI